MVERFLKSQLFVENLYKPAQRIHLEGKGWESVWPEVVLWSHPLGERAWAGRTGRGEAALRPVSAKTSLGQPRSSALRRTAPSSATASRASRGLHGAERQPSVLLQRPSCSGPAQLAAFHSPVGVAAGVPGAARAGPDPREASQVFVFSG